MDGSQDAQPAKPKKQKGLADRVLEGRTNWEATYRALLAVVAKGGGTVIRVDELMESSGASATARIVTLQLVFRETTL